VGSLPCNKVLYTCPPPGKPYSWGTNVHTTQSTYITHNHGQPPKYLLAWWPRVRIIKGTLCWPIVLKCVVIVAFKRLQSRIINNRGIVFLQWAASCAMQGQCLLPYDNFQGSRMPVSKILPSPCLFCKPLNPWFTSPIWPRLANTFIGSEQLIKIFIEYFVAINHFRIVVAFRFDMGEFQQISNLSSYINVL